MKSDMHHLRPCKENVNSYRSNKPFNESNDNSTNNWLWQSFNYIHQFLHQILMNIVKIIPQYLRS